jgi:YgiT-type zinc finger domain-containing protein
MKTCPICKIGTIQDNAKTSLAIEKEGTLIVIKNADAQICDNCGEVFHTGKNSTTNFIYNQPSARKWQRIRIG